MPAVDQARVLADIKILASDDFGGRAPGSPGEAKTVDYLVQQFRAAGVEPGNPDGTFVQKVPLVGITPAKPSPLVVRGPGRRLTFKPHEQVVAFSPRVTESVSVADSPIVFAGYGVQAPEFQWDDFKGLDVKGKTLVVLVNDPPVAEAGNPDALDAQIFGGRAMTYYGRWTYKYEKAAELGAAAVFIVHEAGPAGYPFAVVQGFGGERFGLVTPDRNMSQPAVQGWLSVEAATELLGAAGHDFAALKARARAREFKPVALGLTASMAFSQTLRTIDSQNVIGKITGADPQLRNEYVIYTAHWDHFGTGTPVEGDAIYNGARDNASGTAMLIEFARAFKAVQPPAKRTILLLAVTAEEQGLLGSEYYAKFPLYPLEKTLANINVDALNVWGRTKDLTIIGLGNSELDAYARDAASEQGRVLEPDSEPEKGFYYRSDHFNFAKAGVPALYAKSGLDHVEKGEAYGKEIAADYGANRYHKAADEYDPNWDLGGVMQDLHALYAVGRELSSGEAWPNWYAGNEFKANRDRMMDAKAKAAAPAN
jgi:Zn-dependent M28 family amino/carboxypeptidase